MELIGATRDGREVGYIPYSVDMEVGGENSFVIDVPRGAWSGDLDHDMLIFIPYTEYGGIIGEIESTNNPMEVYCKGYLWRGLLQRKIICPPSGQDYYTISGDANACIRQLITNIYADPLMRGSDETAGVTISSFSFDRYTDLLSGITKMLKTVDYRPEIRYIPEGTGGYVEIGAVPIKNYSATIEYSEDDDIKLVADDVRNGVNHLICLGSGELSARTVVHLFCDSSGTIGTAQSFFGRDEITEVFDYPSAADETELINAGKDRFEEVKSKKKFDASVGRIEEELQVGDIISGRDYVTGINVVKPIERKILRIEREIPEIEYRLEGESS